MHLLKTLILTTSLKALCALAFHDEDPYDLTTRSDELDARGFFDDDDDLFDLDARDPDDLLQLEGRGFGLGGGGQKGYTVRPGGGIRVGRLDVARVGYPMRRGVDVDEEVFFE